MRIVLALAAVGCLLSLADEPPKGLPPKPAPSDYAVQGTWQHATFAASLVPTKQVEHLFAFDISKSFVVFEVACYADSAAETRLSRVAFVVKTNASGDTAHNSEPETVASAVQRQNLPSMPSSHDSDVVTSANIGYERGTDPYTGRPVSGVYGGAGVGVEHGGPDRYPAPQNPKPGGTSEDRRLLETQLRARSLPEGPVHQSVAGYLYFRKSDIKPQADGTYALEYMASDEGSSATHAVMLAVPKKAR